MNPSHGHFSDLSHEHFKYFFIFGRTTVDLYRALWLDGRQTLVTENRRVQAVGIRLYGPLVVAVGEREGKLCQKTWCSAAKYGDERESAVLGTDWL